jgi:predicted kinase
MNAFPFPCPQPPEWRVDWNSLDDDDEYEWIRAMRGCPQDPVFHAEGDVWVHVRMVCEALAAQPEWRGLSQAEREILFAAALLHDQAKPACTREEGGRITSRGHSRRGALDARRILWDLDVGFAVREQVCALVRYHQSPFHLINRPDAQWLAFLISQTARCHLLAMLAKADIMGRECADKALLLDRVALFSEYCREQQCLFSPRRFPSAHSRFLYFRMKDRDPNYLVHEKPRCSVTVMSGLPAAGKDAWIQKHLPGQPVISLDAIRKDLKADATGNQGAVAGAARDQARILLREGRDFVWNATNLSRDLRSRIIDLSSAYDARVRIVYVESTRDALWRQNRRRNAPVPEAAILRLMDRWEVPTPVEADEVEWWVNGLRIQL